MLEQNFATSVEAWRLEEFDHSPRRQLTRMVRVLACMRVELIRQFCRRLSVRGIVSIPLYIVLGFTPGVRDWLWIAGNAAVCGRTERGSSGTGSIMSVMTLASRCFTVMLVLVSAAGKGSNCHGMGAIHWRIELVMLVGTFNHQCYIMFFLFSSCRANWRLGSHIFIITN